MKNWKLPSIILILLILAMTFRWDNLGNITKDGVITKTVKDRWNGTIWQNTIKNGSYEEKIINPSIFEANRPLVEKEEEYITSEKPWPAGETIQEWINKKPITVTKTRIIQVPPEPYYWLSSNGLTRIWTYAIGIIIL